MKLYGRRHNKKAIYQRFTYRGINIKEHFISHISTTEKAANLLRQVDDRFRIFSAGILCSFRWAVWDEPSVILLSEEKCQKRLLCGFIGVNVISRNDINDSVTDCLQIQIRFELLMNRRLGKL